jgi:hypothetical protein
VAPVFLNSTLLKIISRPSIDYPAEAFTEEQLQGPPRRNSLTRMDYAMNTGHLHKDFFRAEGNDLAGLKEAREPHQEGVARVTIQRCWILLDRDEDGYVGRADMQQLLRLLDLESKMEKGDLDRPKLQP